MSSRKVVVGVAARWSYVGFLVVAAGLTLALVDAAVFGPRWNWQAADNPVTAWLTLVFWVAALGAFWAPRRQEDRPLGVLFVSGLAVLAVIGGLASFVPWSADQDPLLTPVWRTLRLFAGDASGPFGPDPDAEPPLVLQLARTAAIGASFATAALAALVLWRRQFNRLAARFLDYADVVIGCDEDALGLVRRLVDDEQRAGRIGVVVSPGVSNKLWRSLSETGAFIVQADPTEGAVIDGLLTRWKWFKRTVAVRRVYVVDPDPMRARVIAEQVREVVAGMPVLTDRAVQIIVRLDDPAQAWKQRLSDLTFSEKYVLDAMVPVEVTATQTLGRALAGTDGDDTVLVICGDTALAAAFLREADIRFRERLLLQSACDAWEEANPGSIASDTPRSRELLGHADSDIMTLDSSFSRVVLMDTAALDIAEVYLAERRSGPALRIDVVVGPWEERLLDFLRKPNVADAQPVVVIADRPSSKSWQVAVRSAQLTPAQVWYHAETAHQQGPMTGLPNLHEFDVSLLLLGWLPDTTWNRIARLQSERYRRHRFKVVEGQLPEARRPWWHTDEELRLPMWRRRDNVDQVRGIMHSIYKQDYRWVRVGSVDTKGFEGDLDAVAEVEHERWLQVQLDHHFHPYRSPADPQGEKLNEACVPWDDLKDKDWVRANVRQVLESIETIGYVPVKASAASLPSTVPPRLTKKQKARAQEGKIVRVSGR